MRAPAIDDHVIAKLYEWYTAVSEWEPPGEGFAGICSNCSGSALARTIDVSAWPHDVIHLLVESLRGAIVDVQHSYFEEGDAVADTAPDVADRAVAAALARHGRDIEDVLEQCLSERLQAYLAGQSELGVREFRRLTAF